MEGEAFEYLLSLRNTGDTAAEGIQLRIDCSSTGFLIGAEGPVKVEADESPPSASGLLSLAVNGEETVRVRVLAPRKSSGDVLTLSVHLAEYSSGVEHWDRHSITIERRPDTSGVVLGGLRFYPAAFWLLGWVIACLMVLGLLTIVNRTASSSAETYAEASFLRRLRKRAPFAPMFMLMIPVAFWMVFGGMAWRDFRVLTAWKQADATIVGRREIVKTSSSTSRSSRQRSSSSTTYTPDFALQYEVEGRTVVSNGFDTGTSLHVGGRVLGEQEYQAWTVGAVIPCWYDPTDPSDVVVRRGFGGAYLFAILPLPIFCFGVVVVRKMMRGRR